MFVKLSGGEKAEAVIADAKTAYKKLTNKLWLHMAANLEQHKLATDPWKQFAPENQGTPPA